MRHKLFDVEQMVQAFQREKLATIGLIAASINHEIKNPLYAVKGLLETYVENEREGLPHRPAVETSERALKQVNRSLDVITKLNRFARPSSGGVKEDLKASIHEAVQNVLDLVAHEFELEKIHIKNEIDPNLPMIQADQRQLEEILLNLIVNACHAMGKSGGQLVIGSERSERSKLKTVIPAKAGIQGLDPRHFRRRTSSSSRKVLRALARALKHSGMTDKVRILIRDTGTGIPPEQAKHLFEPFHTTKGDKGTGLGLYITKQLVERNGGKISVSTKEGKGTSFILEFVAHSSL